YAIGVVIQPKIGVSFTLVAVFWIVVLLSIEGLARGQWLRVMARVVVVAVVLFALYWAIVDWRIVLAWTFWAAAALLLVTNLRDAWRR
ncbi:MAG TPA: hypothetical protein VF143_05510, partial [Candidatus Nanopelagicales bacterium]